MAKKHRSKRGNQKLADRILIGLGIVTVALVIVLVILSNTGNSGDYTITADGHVHAADGTHIGTYDELFGSGDYVMTEDGHIHDAAGNHIASYDDLAVEATAEPAAEATAEPAAE